MAEITFNEVPSVLMEIKQKIDLLLADRGKEPESVDRLLTVEEYQKHIEERTGRRPAKQTVYDQVFKGKVPSERHGKYLYFRKSSIDTWLDNGKQMQ